MNDMAIQEAIKSVEALRNRISFLEDDALDLLFREAQTLNGWSNRPITEEQIQLLCKLTISGPATATSALYVCFLSLFGVKRASYSLPGP